MSTDIMRMIDSTLLQNILVHYKKYVPMNPWTQSLIQNAEICPVLKPHHQVGLGIMWYVDCPAADPKPSDADRLARLECVVRLLLEGKRETAVAMMREA